MLTTDEWALNRFRMTEKESLLMTWMLHVQAVLVSTGLCKNYNSCVSVDGDSVVVTYPHQTGDPDKLKRILDSIPQERDRGTNAASLSTEENTTVWRYMPSEPTSAKL
ncbi:MAG: hypothetical protein KDI46_04915 [Alphaproteobacteria bacterium]|nr:hypothetical protein [Alphaproteobacteria bacterium]